MRWLAAGADAMQRRTTHPDQCLDVPCHLRLRLLVSQHPITVLMSIGWRHESRPIYADDLFLD